MEFVAIKRSRSRRKRGPLKKRRRNKINCEVRKEKQLLFEAECKGPRKERLSTSNMMSASSFWENYTAAQDWQKRHSVTWWRTRCVALEHENQILRDKLRSLAYQCGQNEPAQHQTNEVNLSEQVEDEESVCGEEEDLEFQVNEEMMTFLEQSMRHKIELKKKKEQEFLEGEKREEFDDGIQGGAVWMNRRVDNAKLLYGEASPTILAMETALQTTMDRHKDKMKPQLWPVIPLRP